MAHGPHHFHRRKRIHQKHEPYPHPDKWKNRMDILVYVGGVLGPLLTIPQITKIWVGKSAAGVSIISWSAFLVGALFWTTYGIMHKEKPIIFTYGLWIIFYLMVVVGAVVYS